MLALFIKICVIIFFIAISVDSFYKVKKIEKEIADDLLNPNMGRILRRRAITRGLIYLCATLAAVGTLFIKVAPLGE